MSESRFKTMKDLPAAHLLGTGTAMCAGCGGLEVLHEVYDLLGEKTVFINAAGCMTLLAIYPYTPFRGSWLYTAMASAPTGAQGVRDAFDILLTQGRIAPDEAMKIARGRQLPGQTKEQTRLIAQGIQKGIEQYKKQHKARVRERDGGQ